MKALNGRNPNDSCGNIGESCFEEIAEKISAMETAEFKKTRDPFLETIFNNPLSEKNHDPL
jgi:hypothetical protein